MFSFSIGFLIAIVYCSPVCFFLKTLGWVILFSKQEKNKQIFGLNRNLFEGMYSFVRKAISFFFPSSQNAFPNSILLFYPLFYMFILL